MRCPKWLEHCIRWCGVKGIGPQQPLLLQPLKGVSDPPDRTAGPSRYCPIPAAMACLSGCPVGRWTRHRRWIGARVGGSGYSLKALYINSSSSRERLFVWTSAFSSTLTRTCVAAKYVGRRAQSAGLADNNFLAAAFSVDNCLVVPEICPGLSTAAWGCDPLLVSWPCTAPSGAGPSKKKPGVLCRTPGWQGGEWQRGLKQSLGDHRLQRLSPQFRVTPYLAGAGVGAGPGRPSPPRMPPWWSPCPWRPSPPRMPPMGWPRWAWVSKVFCCSGVSVA